MTSTRAQEGLCRNCVHDPACAFPRRKDRPVLFCEEFVEVRCADASTAPPRPGAVERKAPEVGMGLCCTCDHLDACSFPGARRGVVQCEEYR